MAKNTVPNGPFITQTGKKWVATNANKEVLAEGASMNDVMEKLKELGLI